MQYYLRYLADRPDSIVRRAGRTSPTADGPVVVHCAAGKDRTGVVVAMALAAVGVERAGDRRRLRRARSERIAEIMARLRASIDLRADLAGVTDDSRKPRPEFLERVLDVLDDRDGGPAGWLAEHGFDPSGFALAVSSRLKVSGAGEGGVRAPAVPLASPVNRAFVRRAHPVRAEPMIPQVRATETERALSRAPITPPRTTTESHTWVRTVAPRATFLTPPRPGALLEHREPDRNPRPDRKRARSTTATGTKAREGHTFLSP